MTATGKHVCEGCGKVYDTLGPYFRCRHEHLLRIDRELAEHHDRVAADFIGTTDPYGQPIDGCDYCDYCDQLEDERAAILYPEGWR